MSIYVERRVDTVIMEMGIGVAEQLTEVLARVKDDTRFTKHMRMYGDPIGLEGLFKLLTREEPITLLNGESVMRPLVRHPSPLTNVEVAPEGEIILKDAM